MRNITRARAAAGWRMKFGSKMSNFSADLDGVFSRLRVGLMVGVAALALAACNPGAVPGMKMDVGAPSGGAADAGENIVTGAVKVGLIVPLTGPNGPSAVGSSLRNAAKLAYADSGTSDVTILVKDDRSTPAGAAAAAQTAVNEGAEIILGPVFAGDVKEVGRVAHSAGKPVIAFSTDSSAAGRGNYLLSFLVEGHVDRGLNFASQRGKKSVAALVPESDY